jgi:hypothetical protein
MDGKRGRCPGRSSPDRGEDGLNKAWQLAQIAVGLEQGEDSSVGSSVSEPGHGTLDESPAGALIEARDAAFGVECLGGRGERGPMTILVIHDSSNPL